MDKKYRFLVLIVGFILSQPLYTADQIDQKKSSQTFWSTTKKIIGGTIIGLMVTVWLLHPVTVSGKGHPQARARIDNIEPIVIPMLAKCIGAGTHRLEIANKEVWGRSIERDYQQRIP